MPLSAILDITDLQCAYGDGPLVLSVPRLSIPAGKLVFVVGVSGGGKSTLLETLGLMNRTVQAGSGIVFSAADEPAKEIGSYWAANDGKLDTFRKQHYSFIFQKTNLMPNFSCGENMVLPALLKGKGYPEAKEKVLNYMDRINLPREIFDKKIVDVSGGQRQRLAFIRAMVADFSVLFGDEPTGNLDPKTAYDVMGILKNYLNEHNKTGIVVSHDLGLAWEYADRIVPITMHRQVGQKDFGIVEAANIVNREKVAKEDRVAFDHLKALIN